MVFGFLGLKQGNVTIIDLPMNNEIKKKSFKKFSLFGFFTCLITFVLAFLFKDHLISFLTYLELMSTSNLLEFNLVMLLLFICVSLPVLWGYIICVLICSYVYSFFYGFLTVVLFSTCGMTCSYFICRYMFYDYANTSVQRFEYLKAVCAVIRSNDKGYKIVFLSRLMPVPFGLANAVFAVADVNLFKYILASVVGLMPSQLILCYIGSTFKSMSDVLVNQNTGRTATLVFLVQLVIAFGVMYYILKAAKIEINKHLNIEANKNTASNLNLIEEISTSDLKSENIKLLGSASVQSV